ncbi:alpha/beta fold hydrolase [Nonomuraea antimicrobica]
MVEATLHDGNTIEVEVSGSGPVVLLPVDPQPVEGEQAEEMRKWGNDPALGRSLIDGLSDAFRVVAFDYQGHVMSTPKPATLTPGNVVRDLLAVADAVGAERFAYYGYSWLALSGLQLAIRTDRLTALVMGGFPPYGGRTRRCCASPRPRTSWPPRPSRSSGPAPPRRAPTTRTTGPRSRSPRPRTRPGSSSPSTRGCADSTTGRRG